MGFQNKQKRLNLHAKWRLSDGLNKPDNRGQPQLGNQSAVIFLFSLPHTGYTISKQFITKQFNTRTLHDHGGLQYQRSYSDEDKKIYFRQKRKKVKEEESR